LGDLKVALTPEVQLIQALILFLLVLDVITDGLLIAPDR
jgi:hypothetical protein